MQKIIVMLFVLAAVTGTVSANAWIAPVDAPDNLWSVATHWSTGIVPVITEKTTFTNLSAECIVDFAAVAGQMVVGDNGPTGFTRVLRIVDGGSLIAGGTAWVSAGYNRDSIIAVEEGGSLETTRRLGVGLVGGPLDTPQTSYLNVNGGDVTIDGNLQIGTLATASVSNHTGIVNVNSGTLDVTGNLEFRDPIVGFIDISYGTLTVDGDETALVADMADNVPPNITAFGGAGTLVYDYDSTNPGKTTITAIHPMDPSPIDTTVPVGDVILSWTNLDPNNPGDSVWVDVWFGTDPNKLDTLHYTQAVTTPADGENVITVTVNAPVNGTYYWQVDSYIWGDPALVVYDNDDPEAFHVIEGEVWSFDGSDDSPPLSIYAGVNMLTWANQAVDLLGTYDDDGASTVDATWTSSDPNAVFSPSSDGGVTSTAVNPTVTVDYAAGAVTLTFTVQDQLNPAESDDMIVTVYADACEAARVGDGRAANYPGDFNGDCIVDFTDVAEEIAAKWLEDYKLLSPQ